MTESSPAIADSALTPERIARLRQLHEAATPGPWEHGVGPYGRDVEAGGELIAEVIEEDAKPRSRDDAELIVEARNALPALLAEVERLRSAIRGLPDPPYGAYSRWRQHGAAADADQLSAYDAGLAVLRSLAASSSETEGEDQ